MNKLTFYQTVAAILATTFLTACAHTSVAKWAAAPGKEVLIGQGGAVETVRQNDRDIDVWVDGSPNRPFKILDYAGVHANWLRVGFGGYEYPGGVIRSVP